MGSVLAAAPNVHARTGKTLASWTLAKEFGFTDIDGRTPFFLGYVRRSLEAWHAQLRDAPDWRELCTRVGIALRSGRQPEDRDCRERTGDETIRARE